MRTVMIAAILTLAALVAAAQTQPTNSPPPAPAPTAQASPAQPPSPQSPSNTPEASPAAPTYPKPPNAVSSELSNSRAIQDRRLDPVDGYLARLDTRLSLSEDQKTKIKALLTEERDQTAALRKNDALTPQERVTKQRGLHTETQDKIKKLLTPEQLKKYETPKPPPPGAAKTASE